MSEIIHAKDLRPGNTFIINGDLYEVLEITFNKTAMRAGLVKNKIKNLRTGTIIWKDLTNGRFEKVVIDKIKMSFSYVDGSNYVFMNNTNFETIEISEQKVKNIKNFLVDGIEVSILKYNDEILDINLPETIVCNLIDCEDAVQGNTVKAVMKKAHISTGYEVEVPQFVKKTDRIIISTIDGSYKGRENK